jgi:LEA14-like dessication related protein
MKKLLFLLTIVFLSSCGAPYEEIVFVEIKDAQLEKATGNQLDIVATCVLYNPNSEGLNFKEADFDVYISGKKAAVIHQREDVVMPANSEFEFPIKTSVNLTDIYGDQGIGILGAALQFLASQKVDVKYQGTIIVGKGMVNFSIPVQDSLSVPVKFNF